MLRIYYFILLSYVNVPRSTFFLNVMGGAPPPERQKYGIHGAEDN